MDRVLVLLSLSLFALLPHAAATPAFINGQTFTDGLAIIDAPAPLSPAHAGSPINIAVDVSGDGQLPLAASIPGSGRSTGFESLEIYLVSAQTNLNLTVSNTTDLLTNEASSTVKHLNWPVPACVPAGNYNLTFYEASVFNGQAVYAITPIPIQVENANPSGQCSDLNTLQTQPQPSLPLPESPFTPDPLQTLTLTLSNGILHLPTVTVTSSIPPATVVIISESTVTETDKGSITVFTETATLTTVVALSTTSASGEPDNSSGFIPVNSASHAYSSTLLSLCIGIWTLGCVLSH